MRRLSKVLKKTYRSYLPARYCSYADIVDEKYEDEGISSFALRNDESIRDKRARLLYQSRKRGMLENGLLLSIFSGKYLGSMSREELDEYDLILNRPCNDWELFYWVTDQKPVPEIYNNSVFKKMKEFTKNEAKEKRLTQPDVEIFKE